MGLLQLCLVIIIIGVLLYCVNRWVPMDAKIKKILNVVVVVVLLIWLASLFIGYVPDIRIRR